MQEYEKNASVPPPPHRPWENEPQCSSNYVNNNNFGNLRPGRVNTGEAGVMVSDNQSQQTGASSGSNYHDNVQVYHSVDHSKKLKRLEYLKNTKTKPLAPMEAKVAYRFVLTKLHPLMDADDIEKYLFDNFKAIKDLYVRKCKMTHDDYSTFIFIVNSNEHFHKDEVVHFDWPGKITCFFSPNDNRRRY